MLPRPAPPAATGLNEKTNLKQKKPEPKEARRGCAIAIAIMGRRPPVQVNESKS